MVQMASAELFHATIKKYPRDLELPAAHHISPKIVTDNSPYLICNFIIYNILHILPNSSNYSSGLIKFCTYFTDKLISTWSLILVCTGALTLYPSSVSSSPTIATADLYSAPLPPLVSLSLPVFHICFVTLQNTLFVLLPWLTVVYLSTYLSFCVQSPTLLYLYYIYSML